VFLIDFSDTQYKCLKLFKRTDHVQELQEGRLTAYKTQACAPDFMDELRMPYTTLLSKLTSITLSIRRLMPFYCNRSVIKTMLVIRPRLGIEGSDVVYQSYSSLIFFQKGKLNMIKIVLCRLCSWAFSLIPSYCKWLQ
jgi:hypothetical protein